MFCLDLEEYTDFSVVSYNISYTKSWLVFARNLIIFAGFFPHHPASLVVCRN